VIQREREKLCRHGSDSVDSPPQLIGGVSVGACVKHVGRFVGDFEGDVMKELLVDEDDPSAQPTRSLFHRS